MTHPRLILITGKARHGKDTIADWYVKYHGFQKHMIAQPLKDICRIIFNFTDGQVNQAEKDIVDDRWQVTPRTCLQFIGTELMRNQIKTILPEVGENIWAKCLVEKLKAILQINPQAKFVISDVRYENELVQLKSELTNLPSWSIRVVNPRINAVECAVAAHSVHTSENQMFATDQLIENNSTFESLYQQLTNSASSDNS